jgi:hypothetical protein
MDRASAGAVEVFPSRRERWPTVLFLGTFAITLFLAVRILLSDAGAPLKAILGVAAFGIGPVVLWVLLGTGYSVTAQGVLLHAGPFRFRAALADLESLSEAPGGGGGDATRRLQLGMRGGRTLVVSPRDPGAFAAALLCRLPSLRVEGAGLRAAAGR